MPGLPVLAGPGFLRAVRAAACPGRTWKEGSIERLGLCGRTPVQALRGAFAARAS
jgi:hypothetical protein